MSRRGQRRQPRENARRDLGAAVALVAAMLPRRAFGILPLAGLFAAGCVQGATSTDATSSALSEKNGWANGWANGWNNGWANGWANGWINGWANGWINGWANGWANGFNNGWANGLANRWAHGWAQRAQPTSGPGPSDASEYPTPRPVADRPPIGRAR